MCTNIKKQIYTLWPQGILIFMGIYIYSIYRVYMDVYGLYNNIYFAQYHYSDLFTLYIIEVQCMWYFCKFQFILVMNYYDVIFLEAPWEWLIYFPFYGWCILSSRHVMEIICKCPGGIGWMHFLTWGITCTPIESCIEWFTFPIFIG